MAQVIAPNIQEKVKVCLEWRGKLGSRIAARFAGVGLEMPLPELCGQPIDAYEWQHSCHIDFNRWLEMSVPGPQVLPACPPGLRRR